MEGLIEKEKESNDGMGWGEMGCSAHHALPLLATAAAAFARAWR